ncbi:hypothetical protein FACS1894140_1450 [Spirochaetia bacterium]|nr:hypothetical protein FACS1894140_1450 [Spirochaetia bacterium]
MAENIINKMFSLIGGGNEPVSDKDLLLKQTAKELAQNKYTKFYRPKTEEIDPAFAQYLYAIYKIIYPAQAFLKDAANIKKLKQLCFEHSLNPEVQEIVRRLSPEMIEERAGKTAPDDFVRQLQGDFDAVSRAFDKERIAAVNKCYSLITAFKQFVLFDFISFLQKFDPVLPEGLFTAPPKFAAAMGTTLVQDINNFYTAICALEPPSTDGDDWTTAFTVMKAARGGTGALSPTQWNMLLANMKELTSSRILKIMVRLISKNPVWDGNVVIPDEHLCETWLEKTEKDIYERIGRIADKQRNARMEVLVKAIFGKLEVEKLTFYSVNGNKVYTERGLEGFVYAAGLNYVMTFIQDYVKKDIQEICDLVLVRGQWSSINASLQMSEAFHKILGFPPAIEALDNSLSEDGSYGPRLKGALLRLDRDNTEARSINSIIGDIDEEALDLIKKAAQNLIIIGKSMKALADDLLKKPTELIINWKNLDGFSGSPVAPQINDIYKKINYFIQLMTLVTCRTE